MNELTHSSAKVFLSSAGGNKVVNSKTINTDITFYFQPMILSNTDASHFIIGLEQASIPISINMVNANNNTLVLNSVSYVITPGNYTITQLITALNLLAPLFLFTYNSNTNQITINAVSGLAYTVGAASTCNKLLGTAAGTYNPGFGTQPGIVNLTYTTGIVLQLDNVTTTNRDNSGASGATLARIPISCSTNRILQYFNATPFFSQIANRDLSYFRVKLLNDDYTPLVLTGNPDWFIVIRVDYSEKNLPSIIPSDITKMRQEQIRAQDAILLERA